MKRNSPSLRNAPPRNRVAPAAVLVVASALLLQGCGAFVVAGATYGAAVAYDRRDTQTVLDDEWIETRARDVYLKHPDISDDSNLSVTSYNYTALITGQAPSADAARRYAELVSALPKVQRVYNEAEIGPIIGIGQVSSDTLLGSRAKVAIQSIDLPGFDALRVKIVAENGVLYLMGLVTPEEGEATAEKVRRIPGVQRVVKIFDYVEPQTEQPAASAAT